MKLELLLKGEVPAKKNSRVFNTRTHRSFPSSRYLNWHKQAVLDIKQQAKGQTFERCYISLIFCHGDKRRRDSDNGVSSVFDTLVDAGVIPDDNWNVIIRHEVSNIYEKNNAKCIITITGV